MSDPRTADDYASMLTALLPPGRLWPTERSSALQGLLRGLASDLADIEARAARLLEELDPRTTRDLLPEWERLVGLPDECTSPAATVAERRARVVQRFAMRPGGATAAYLQSIATLLGYTDVIVDQLHPCECGYTECGEEVGGDDADVYYIAVRAGAARVTRFRTGVAMIGDRLGMLSRAEDLECVLRRIKPAHAELIFDYEGI